MVFLQPIKTCMKLLPSAFKSLGSKIIKYFPAGSASLEKCYRQLVSWLITKMPFLKTPIKLKAEIVAPRSASDGLCLLEYVIQLNNGETLYIKCDYKKLTADLATLAEILTQHEMGR